MMRTNSDLKYYKENPLHCEESAEIEVFSLHFIGRGGEAAQFQVLETSISILKFEK